MAAQQGGFTFDGNVNAVRETDAITPARIGAAARAARALDSLIGLRHHLLEHPV